jgi:hypothetical protein
MLSEQLAVFETQFPSVSIRSKLETKIWQLIKNLTINGQDN